MISLTLQKIRNRARDVLHTQRLARVLARTRGIGQLREFRRPHWHLGSRYYTGISGETGERVFVKFGASTMIGNEIEAWTRLWHNGGRSENLARMIAGAHIDAFPLAAFEYVSDDSLENLISRSDPDQLKAAAQNLLRIIDMLYSEHVVHRDVRPSNLLLRRSSQGRVSLVLIDFAFAVIDGRARADDTLPFETLLTLGDGLNPRPLQWDDAYSAWRICQTLERAGGIALLETIELERRIGRMIYTTSRHS